MKCPKCGYLGFEPADRCRNCGYDFSLSSPTTMPELSLRLDDHDVNPLDDLAMVDTAMPPPPTRSMSDVGMDLERLIGVPSAQVPSAELPLFGPPIPDDEPLITRPSPPRQPLAVRRSTPEAPRLRSEQPRLQALDLALDESPAIAQLRSTMAARRDGERSTDGHAGEDAAVTARFVAVVVDLLILAIIDAAVIYFTLQICGITIDELGILPKGPLLAFLLVQNGGYLVAFTAGGQTLGKMAAGIRVVPSESESSLDLSRAFLRESMWLVLAMPAGLGFLTALFSRDHRGLHDRFAGTRVVR
jgi:uncharacterized RDD family membrane protein YckC